MKVDRRLYLDIKGNIVEGPPKSVELFKPQGGEVSKAELDKYGKQLEKYIPGLKKKQAEKPQDKQAKKSQDKRVKLQESKGQTEKSESKE